MEVIRTLNDVFGEEKLHATAENTVVSMFIEFRQMRKNGRLGISHATRSVGNATIRTCALQNSRVSLLFEKELHELTGYGVRSEQLTRSNSTQYGTILNKLGREISIAFAAKYEGELLVANCKTGRLQGNKKQLCRLDRYTANLGDMFRSYRLPWKTVLIVPSDEVDTAKEHVKMYGTQVFSLGYKHDEWTQLLHETAKKQGFILFDGS